MRIVYVQQHFATPHGEAGVRGYNLVKTFVDRGHNVTVIAGHNWRDDSLKVGPGQWRAENELDGFRLVRLGVYYSNFQGFWPRLRSFVTFAALASREVVRRDADLVFASSPPLTMALPALVGRWARGIPYVLEVRDLWPDFPIEMGIIRNPVLKRVLWAFERLAYRRAWRLVALAPGIKRQIEGKAGVAPSSVLMVPNGSDTAGLWPVDRPARRHLPVGRNELVLGYTGTLGVANGLDAVLDAARVLKRRRVHGVTFALIGDGREKTRLMCRAAREGLDNVRFTGLVGKGRYNEILAELDVGLQILMNVKAFYYGTSPNKFFDYLAAGKPVLVNYPGWMSDLVTQHECGVAVAPDDPDLFADAVERLLEDRDRLSAMGRAARVLAEAEFSQQRILVDLARFVEGGTG
jgi:glycosyltransferase involved in cell wall biosynthesis